MSGMWVLAFGGVFFFMLKKKAAKQNVFNFAA